MRGEEWKPAGTLSEFAIGKNALNWTPLSCHSFAASQVRLKLFALA